MAAALTIIMGFFDGTARGQRLQPERRSGVRILTLKNAGWFVLFVALLLFLISSYTEIRARGEADHGRLFNERVAAPADRTQKQTRPTRVDEGSDPSGTAPVDDRQKEGAARRSPQ